MYFSGKISNSFFCFLRRCEFDTSRFFEMTPLELDFLKDPHSWMNAQQVELLLGNIQKAFQYQFMDKDLVTTVGHNSVSLKCWGGLDDFLRMFESPYEIHEKLEIFFSYFVTPVFKVYNKKQDAYEFSFKTNFKGHLYPTVTSYFAAVLEALPLFMGGVLTKVKWEGNQVTIYYPKERNLLLPLEGLVSFQRHTALLKQIEYCRKNLKEFKKTGLPHLIEDTLSVLSQMRNWEEQQNKYLKEKQNVNKESFDLDAEETGQKVFDEEDRQP